LIATAGRSQNQAEVQAPIEGNPTARHSPAAMDHLRLTEYLERQLPAALELLRRMVELNSWTLNPEGVNAVARLTAEAFAPLGFAAEFVPSTNPEFGDHLVLTRGPAGGPALALVSHLDTVFPPEEELRNNFRWQPEGDRIFGPGTHDIKGGTVMMWLVLHALREFAPAQFAAVNWQLYLNSSEELLSPDFGEMCRARFGRNALAALVFEAEGKLAGGRRLVRCRKGRATWRITTTGRGAHAGVKHGRGANAIVQLGRTLDRVAALTDYARELTFNPGVIRGGGGLNRVPHEAVAEGEMRAFDPAIYAAGKAALLGLSGAGDVASPVDGYPCAVQAEILSESRPWPVNAGTDRLLAVFQKVGQALGQAIEGEARGGLSDGNYLWDALPTIDGLGPAGDNDHCSERSADGSKLPEYCEVSSFVPKAALNALAILQLATDGLR
jgi:glutamate carboxypeptidase